MGSNLKTDIKYSNVKEGHVTAQIWVYNLGVLNMNVSRSNNSKLHCDLEWPIVKEDNLTKNIQTELSNIDLIFFQVLRFLYKRTESVIIAVSRQYQEIVVSRGKRSPDTRQYMCAVF